MKNNLYENILNCYENNENFYVRYNNSNNGLCYIYCSSNALYVGGSSESFDNLILKKNRYEWEHISSGTKPEKEIFIRDIFMSWYVNGLSKQNDSYEKIIDVISCECKGYKVRTVGVSSGGYMACLLGIQTKADLCYLLSPQITIRHHYNHCEENKYIKRYLSSHTDYWLEIYKQMKNSSTRFIYVYPSLSDQDVNQASYLPELSQDKLVLIPIRYKEHGVVFQPYALSKFLSMSFEDCKSFFKFSFFSESRTVTSIRLGGFLPFIHWVIKKLNAKFKTKIVRI